jgi:hypothetical protein
MLQGFYLNVAYICSGFQVFLGVFASVFIRLFQVWATFGVTFGAAQPAARVLAHSLCRHRPEASAPNRTSKRL